MSGFPADEIVRRGLLPEHQSFIQKPFAPVALAAAVRALLDAAAEKEIATQPDVSGGCPAPAAALAARERFCGLAGSGSSSPA